MRRRNRSILLATAAFSALLLYSILALIVYRNSKLINEVSSGSVTNDFLSKEISRSHYHDALFFRSSANKLQYSSHNPEILKQSYELSIRKGPADYENLLSFAFYSASLKCCPERTVRLVREAVKRKPIDAKVHRTAASLLLAKGEKKDAFELLNRTLTLNHEMANEVYSIVERNGGTVDDLIDITPRSSTSLIRLFSFLSSKRNRFADKQEYLLQKLDELPLKPEERVLAAKAALSAGNIEWAKAQVSRTLDHPGTRIESLKILAAIYRDEQNWKEFEFYAGEVVNSYRQKGNESGAAAYSLQTAMLLSDAEGADKTAERLNQIIDTYPRFAPTYFAMAELQEQETPELSLFFMQEAARLDPYNFTYSSKLAERYLEISMITEAEDIYTRFSHLPKYSLGAYLGLASCKQRARRPKEAIEILERARKKHRKSTALLHELGLAYQGISDYRKAAEVYKELAALTPRKAIGHVLAAGMYEKAGEYSQAIKHYEEALEIAPNNKEARHGLSQIQTNSPKSLLQ